MSRCPTWCRSAHTSADRVHRLQVGPLDGPGRLLVRLIQGERDGVLGEPLVRLVYRTLDGDASALDLSPALAGDLADVLAGLSVTGRQALAEALAHINEEATR